MILANTLFQCVCYHPEEFQIITSGTDRKVSKHRWPPTVQSLVSADSVNRECLQMFKGGVRGGWIASLLNNLLKYSDRGCA